MRIQILQTQQIINDVGDLLGGFGKIVVDPGSGQVCRDTGVEFCLVAAMPGSHELDLPATMLDDGVLQQVEQPPAFQQAQPLPLGQEKGVDGQDPLPYAVLEVGDGAVDLPEQGDAVLTNYILRQIEVAIEGGTADTGLLDDLGGGDIRWIFGFQQLEVGIGNVVGDTPFFHETKPLFLYHFFRRWLHKAVESAKISQTGTLEFPK